MNGSKITVSTVNAEGKYYVKKPIPIKAVAIPGQFWVESLEGNHQGKPGDYLIRGVKGEIYICDKDIFEQTYEEVSPPGGR